MAYIHHNAVKIHWARELYILCTYTYTVYVGPLRPSFQKFYWLFHGFKRLFDKICPLLLYANIHNMIVGFSFSFSTSPLQCYM